MSSIIAINEDVVAELSTNPYQGDLLKPESIFKRLFNANTAEFLTSAAIVGSASYATRIGVLAAATTAGASVLPAALLAGAVVGLATGSLRFGMECRKGRYDLSDPAVHKILLKRLLMSTALSTVGGGIGYAFVNHYDFIAEVAQKTGVPAWISSNYAALANSPVGIAVGNAIGPVRTAVADTYNAIARPALSAMAENGRAFMGQAYEGIAAYGAYLKGAYNSLPDVSAGVESAAQTVKGWWKSAMNAVGFSQEAQASTPAAVQAPSAPQNSVAVQDRPATLHERFIVRADGTLPGDPPGSESVSLEEMGAKTVTTIRYTPDGAVIPDNAAPQQVQVAAMEESVPQPQPDPRIQVEPSSSAVAPVEPPPSYEIAERAAETPQYVQDYLAGITGIKQSVPSFAGLDFTKTWHGYEFPEFDANSTPKYLPKLEDKFTVRPWGNRFDLLASEVTPENVSQVVANLNDPLAGGRSVSGVFESKAFSDHAGQVASKATGIDVSKNVVAEMPAPAPAPAPAPVSAPAPAPASLAASSTGSMKEQIGSYFEGKNISPEAGRIMEKAMSGNLQGQKDLAVGLLHGQNGLPKDPAMAMKLYDNVIAEGSVEGKRPRGAVFQAIRDKAWVQFYGYGNVASDQEAAKATMAKLAEFNSGARRTLAEWTGEKVRHVAAASKHAVSSVKESVTGKASKLACDWVKVDGRIVSGNCRGNLGLKVGDKITLNP